MPVKHVINTSPCLAGNFLNCTRGRWEEYGWVLVIFYLKKNLPIWKCNHGIFPPQSEHKVRAIHMGINYGWWNLKEGPHTACDGEFVFINLCLHLWLCIHVYVPNRIPFFTDRSNTHSTSLPLVAWMDPKPAAIITDLSEHTSLKGPWPSPQLSLNLVNQDGPKFTWDLLKYAVMSC